MCTYKYKENVREFYSADKNNSYKISKRMDGISKYYFGEVRDGNEEWACGKDDAKLGSCKKDHLKSLDVNLLLYMLIQTEINKEDKNMSKPCNKYL